MEEKKVEVRFMKWSDFIRELERRQKELGRKKYRQRKTTRSDEEEHHGTTATEA